LEEVLGWGYGLSCVYGAGSKVYGRGFCGPRAAENSTMDDVDDDFSENIINTTGIIKKFAPPQIFAWDNDT
jgi:hypothetical protein